MTEIRNCGRTRFIEPPRLLFVPLLIVVTLCHGIARADKKQVLEQLERSRAAYQSTELWTARRNQLRKGFLMGAGLWPLPTKAPLNVITHSRRSHDGYTVENVAIETMPGFYCTGNLYRPIDQNEAGPGILCPHGHFKPLGRFRVDQQIRCAHFARMGASVFSYSMVGYQDSRQTLHSDPLVLALQTWNSVRGIDFLSELKGVDRERLGMTGASGGGTQTFFVAMLDERVKVSAPVVIVYPWTEPDGCLCEGGMPIMKSTHTNAIELAAAVAPRAQLLISVGGDATRDFPTVGFPFIEHIYSLTGQSGQVANLHLADENHDFGPSKRNTVYAFFAKHLEMTPRREDLTQIVIEPPEQMEVFNQQNPLPEHAVHGVAEVAKAFESLPRPTR